MESPIKQCLSIVAEKIIIDKCSPIIAETIIIDKNSKEQKQPLEVFYKERCS